MERRVFDGADDAANLQRLPELVEPGEIVHVWSICAQPVVAAEDQPVRQQPCECLTHGCARDSVQLGQAFLAESFRCRDRSRHEVTT